MKGYRKVIPSLQHYSTLTTAFLAFGSPAAAEVVFRELDLDGGLHNDGLFLDLDGDGLVEMRIGHRSFQSYSVSSQSAYFLQIDSNLSFVGYSPGSAPMAPVLFEEDHVSPSDAFVQNGSGAFFGNVRLGRFLDSAGSTAREGAWLGRSGYAGFRFDILGQTHYGWLRLDWTDPRALLVMAFAYESVPDAPIELTLPTETMDCIAAVEAPVGLQSQFLDDGTLEMTWAGNPNAEGYIFYAQEVETQRSTKFWIDEPIMQTDRLRRGHTYRWSVSAACLDEEGEMVYTPRAAVQTVTVPGNADPGRVPSSEQGMDFYAANQRLVIHSPVEAVIRVEIMDMTSKLVHQYTGSFHKRVEPLVDYPKGTYVVRITAESGQTLSRTIVAD